MTSPVENISTQEKSATSLIAERRADSEEEEPQASTERMLHNQSHVIKSLSPLIEGKVKQMKCHRAVGVRVAGGASVLTWQE